MVTIMNTGQRPGLGLLYFMLAGYAVLMVRIFVQMLFRRAIEKHRRRQFTEKNGGAAYPTRAFFDKRGWANTWMPRNPEVKQPAENDKSTRKFARAAPIVKQAFALVRIIFVFGLAWTVAA